MNASPLHHDLPGPWIEVIKQQVASLRYGVVQIVVHDRRVVQIDRTEKLRFSAPEPAPEAAD